MTPADPDLSAVYVEVPVAEPLVGRTRLRWDASAAAGVPAHVTVLYPFLAPGALDGSVVSDLRAIASTVPPFEVTFDRVGRFPEVVWLAPDPASPFVTLTDALVARWPDHPPYGGAIEEVVHHLTVADGAPSDVLDALEAELATGLPIGQRITELTVAVSRAGIWSPLHRIPLGEASLGTRRA